MNNQVINATQISKLHDIVGIGSVPIERLFARIYARFQKNGIENPIQDMVRISNSPILIACMLFGKHKGILFRDIPTDYLDWLQSTELDEDMAYTVRHYLQRG